MATSSATTLYCFQDCVRILSSDDPGVSHQDSTTGINQMNHTRGGREAPDVTLKISILVTFQLTPQAPMNIEHAAGYIIRFIGNQK